MKCPKCRFENLEGAKFCNECGNKLELTCPECGKVNPGESKFCNEGGNDLRTPTGPSPIDLDQPHSYTPKHLVDKIFTSRSSIEGERKLVTVLFADVAKYTSISEKLDPEEVHQIMDGCFEILMDEIHKYEGTINQLTGDGVTVLPKTLLVWGAGPIEVELVTFFQILGAKFYLATADSRPLPRKEGKPASIWHRV